ncbi:glycine zipper 2TM domain-containing protein [Qipengyuania pacifica]|uniref:glycine zipper 2TM domain-containing protein n=1 Tax=Qipengyuania pacifica TaxID=2860199 RepID=UPI002006F6DE|nr:glycine zipper 2TM domain-containing protein [Qipengyuania pacifica]
MNARAAIVLTVSSLALIPFGALAQNTIPYEVGQYEFAQPLPELDDDVVTETVTEDAAEAEQAVQSNAAPVFVSNPTIQTIDPSDSAYAGNETVPAARSIPARAGADFVTTPTPAAGSAPVIYRDASRSAPMPSARRTENVPGTTTYNAATYLPAGGQVVAFDRLAWLDECRARLDTYDNESERGKVMGALIGGVAGGVLGNRIAGAGNRTPGTLIGAGAGVAAGMAVGDAIDDRNRSRSDSYGQCEAYLDDYMRSVTAEAGSVQYVQPGQYMLVPVTVSVPQRVIYRERTAGN